MGYDEDFVESMRKLNETLKAHLRLQEDGMKLLGALEQIFTIMTPPPKVKKATPTPLRNETGVTEITQKNGLNGSILNGDEIEGSSIDIDFQIDDHKKPKKIVIDWCHCVCSGLFHFIIFKWDERMRLKGQLLFFINLFLLISFDIKGKMNPGERVFQLTSYFDKHFIFVRFF